ncbi:hypothetical protein BU25DRAFT_414625 [Macroventuria anomochaeta]|uniref:Uncharacterized protein n=1 Tax=Macroventuria anomochaeta TaxID=301207 RepID=A0ACB6RMU2_9PLEO|nr:uncharacterized protein BU25DRAFT_414625 [Macroventuria anomochaeta]KAF2623104.1 hypothetical protein BU25DRAFT_414625 [Macroventuria anomochaeta]
MSQQYYFSCYPEMSADERRNTRPARPNLPERKSSRAMRDIIPPWAEMPATPPSCRSVSFSRWSRFTTSGSSTSTGELKASKLCANHGTSPTYNPPANEWTYLGAEQPLRCGKPEVQRSRHRRQQSAQQSSQQSSGTCPSLSSRASTMTSSSSQTEPMDFRRRDVQRASTSSQLTESFKASPAKGGQEQPPGMLGVIARLGLNAVDCEGFPSAFDSEDEDEIDMEDLRPAKPVAGEKGGVGRSIKGGSIEQ